MRVNLDSGAILIYVDILNFAIRKVWRRNRAEYDVLYCRDLASDPVIGYQGDPLDDGAIIDQMSEAACACPDEWQGYAKIAREGTGVMQYLLTHRDSILCRLRTRPIGASDAWYGRGELDTIRCPRCMRSTPAGMESCVRCDALLIIAVDKEIMQELERGEPPSPASVPCEIVRFWTHLERTRILDTTARISSQETYTTDGIFFELCRVLFYCVKDVARDWHLWLTSSLRDREIKLQKYERTGQGLIRLENGLDKRAKIPRLPMHLKFGGRQCGAEDEHDRREMS